MIVVTWNMQGSAGDGQNKWNTTVQKLFKDCQADVLCLQECGMLPADWRENAIDPEYPDDFTDFSDPPAFDSCYLEHNYGTASRPFNIYVWWVHADTGANRCNLAVVSRVPPISPIYLDNPIQGGRPAVGMRFVADAAVGGTIDVYSMHAFSGGGGDAPGFVDAIAAMPQWSFIAGDFNRPPGSTPLQAPNLVECNNNGVETRGAAGTNLDYAFSSNGNGYLGIVLDGVVVSDHYPVGYTL